MKKELDNLLKILNIDEESFKKEWNFSNEELEIISKDNESLFLRRLKKKKEEKEPIEKFSDIYCHFKSFVILEVPTDMVMNVFNEKHKYKGEYLSVFDLIKNKIKKEDNYDDYFFISKILDKKYDECFKELKIGKRMSHLDKLNKEISEKLFGYLVDVKEVWEYSEGGDYTVLKVQSRVEVYDDGSDWWEDIKTYSSNIENAWLVVKKFQEMGAKISINNLNSVSWEVQIEFNNKKTASLNSNICVAICESALKSLI